MKIIIDIDKEQYLKILKDPFLNDGVYKAIKNGTPLDKIRAEIESEKHIGFTPQDFADGLDLALEIINKHIKNEVNYETNN